MIGIYLSGTGNTKHCVQTLIKLLDSSAECIPLEDPMIISKLENQQEIILGYPTQYSNAPFMVRDFIKSNSSIWKDKKIFCLNTMGLFSGDGTGCTARLLKRYGAIILGGAQIQMPDSVCDSKLLKKSLDENKRIVQAADVKIKNIAELIKNGSYPTEGLSSLDHVKGLFGQRLWFYTKTLGYTDKLKISDKCTGCGSCARSCPMHNIAIKNLLAVAGDRCTMCYRCISLCPNQAITLLGKEVREQCRFEKYQ